MKNLLLPPACCALIGLIGLVLVARGRRRVGFGLAWSAVLTCLALSVPHVGTRLLGTLQTYPALDPSASHLDADVIVLLSGDLSADPPEFGADQPGPLSLERCRYAAALARRTHLPLLVTGGHLRPGRASIAEVLTRVVEDEFHVPVRWREEGSLSTRDNARLTAALLRAEGVGTAARPARIALVTHAWHMPRAARAFEREGLVVLAAPTAAVALPDTFWTGCIPRAKALQQSSWAIHEWLGRWWYGLTDRRG
ncbi:MAG: YdcF family protein [Planctomycetota bacterium]